MENCIKCGIEPRRNKQRWCKKCHNANMREWRKTHKLTGEALLKSNARSYLHVYIKRGKVIKGNCEVCGDANTEGHHSDYSKPLYVRWLCRKHHLESHS